MWSCIRSRLPKESADVPHLAGSGVDFEGPVGAVRVGYLNGQFILNPTASQLEQSDLDAAHLRLRLETLTFAGVVTRYQFTPTRHVGFASDDLAYLRWSPDRSAPFLAADAKEDAK